MFNSIRKFYQFLTKEYRKKLTISIILTAFDTLFNMTKIISVYYLISDVINNKLSPTTGWMTFLILFIGIVGSFSVKYFSTILMCEVGYGSCAFKRIEIAKRLRYTPMGYFSEKSINEIIAVSTTSLEMLEQVATHIIMMTSAYLLNTFILIIALFAFDARIGALTFGLLLIYFLITHSIIKASAKDAEKLANHNNTVVTEIIQYVEGISEVKSYNLGKNFNGKLFKLNQENSDIALNITKKFIPFIQSQKLFVKLMGLLVIMLSSIFYFQNTMDLAETITVIISSFLMFASLDGLTSYIPLLKIFDTNINQINEVFDCPQYKTTPASSIPPKNHNISVKNIEFSYSQKKIIDNISCSIKEKEMIALVGPSGSGKTTLAKLIARFWDVDKGEIELGDRNIKDINYDSLIKNYSFVFQEVYLFNDTIENNIRLSKPNASRDEVISAAKKAHCHEFISKLDDGYDTLIGKDGINLSGGERQRISIARAIMKDSPIIILDEATANIDPEYEELLIKAIESLTKNKTVIMIAHRLKTVRSADKIFVIDHGSIVDSGKHEKLMKTCNMYRNFVQQRDDTLQWTL